MWRHGDRKTWRHAMDPDKRVQVRKLLRQHHRVSLLSWFGLVLGSPRTWRRIVMIEEAVEHLGGWMQRHGVERKLDFGSFRDRVAADAPLALLGHPQVAAELEIELVAPTLGQTIELTN